MPVANYTTQTSQDDFVNLAYDDKTSTNSDDVTIEFEGVDRLPIPGRASNSQCHFENEKPVTSMDFKTSATQ